MASPSPSPPSTPRVSYSFPCSYCGKTLPDSGLPGLLFAPARLETAPAAVQSALESLLGALNGPGQRPLAPNMGS